MLVQHQEKLVRLGLLTNLDEVAAARRSWQRLMGPTGVNFFKIEQDRDGKKCWKHLLSGRDQALLSLRALKEGLVKAKERRFLAQSEAKLCMTERKYQSKKEGIKRKCDLVKHKESKRLSKKEMNIKRRNSDCRKHVLCNWIMKEISGRDQERTGT